MIKEPKSKEAVFGTLMHSTMKFIHNPSLLQPKLEEALEFFSKNWNADIFENELEERSAFTQGVEMIQKYYKSNNPSDYNVVDLESRFQIEIEDNDKKTKHIISGIIDRIDKTDEGYEIIDYKTTKKMPSQEKVDNDLQLSIYLNAFLSRYPKEIEHLDNIKVSLYYLKHGVKLTSSRTLEQLKNTGILFLEVIAAIEEKKFEPNVTPLCDWCGYQKLCPMWKHKFKEQRKIDTEDVNAAIGEYINLKYAISSTKNRIAELQEKITQYMEQEGVGRVFNDEGVIAQTIRKTFKYDEKKLREILEPLDKWDSILKVDGIALKNILGILSPAVRKEVEKTKTIDKESRSLIVKKK